MKNTKYLEKEPVKLTGYTLVLPSVSVGNVGQLAVDLLLHNLPCRHVGAFSHPSVQAIVGNLPHGPDGQAHLMTAVEAYACDDKKLFIVQIRSPISPKGRLSLLADLVAWSVSAGLCRVVQLASCHAAVRPDPAAPLLCHLATAAADVSGLAERAPPQPEPPRTDWEHRPRLTPPGAGFVGELCRACDTADLPYTCLLRHTYEGNNIPEAVDLCNCLDSWIGLLNERPSTKPATVLGRWRMPPTWSHLFGPTLDTSLY